MFAYSVGIHLLYFVLATAAFFAVLKTVGMDELSRFSAVFGFFLALSFTVSTSRFFVAAFSAIAIAAALYIANLFFDVTYDGVGYHQEAILNISHHFSLFVSDIYGHYSKLVINYPKLSWFYGAALYSASGNIAVSKSINVLLMISVFLTTLAVLRDETKLTKALFAFLLALNPIGVSQVFSNFVDGDLGCFLTIAALGLYSYARSMLKPSQSTMLFLAGALGASTLKFTGFVFSFVCVCFFLCLYAEKRGWLSGVVCVRGLLPNSFHQATVKSNALSRRFIAFFCLLSFVLLWNPYGLHIVDGKHIFHPAMGVERSVDLIAGQTTPEFFNLDPLSKLLISVFSQSSDHGFWVKSPLPSGKIPFAIYPCELESFKSVGVRVGGWGPLFGGVLLLSLILLLSRVDACRDYYLVLIFLFVISIINPESWWARFNPQLYVLVVFTLLANCAISPTHKVVAQILACVLLLNTVLVFRPMLAMYIEANRSVEKELTQLVQLSADGTLYWKMNLFHLEPIFERMNIKYANPPTNIDIKKMTCAVFDTRFYVFSQEKVCVFDGDNPDGDGGG